MTALLRVIDKVAATLALFAGVAIAVLAILIAIDIIGRDFFGASIQGTDEIGGYVLALVGSLGMALTLLRRGHPRIDIFFRFFPRSLRGFLHALAQVTLAGFALFMTWYAWGELATTLRYGSITNTPLQTPLWVPQAFWVGGLAFFALTACITALHACILLMTDTPTLLRRYGPLTIDEEVSHYVDASEADNARN